MRLEHEVFSIIVKQHRPNDSTGAKLVQTGLAVAEAKKRTSEAAVLETSAHAINQHEVKLLVQCPITELQEWYNDGDKDKAPFPNGTLLLFSTWSKSVEEAVHQAQELVR